MSMDQPFAMAEEASAVATDGLAGTPASAPAAASGSSVEPSLGAMMGATMGAPVSPTADPGVAESADMNMGMASTPAEQAANTAPVDAATMAQELGFGTNIGNTLENTTEWETGWGQPMITRAYIEGMASGGIKTVRVPVAWDTYAQNGTVPGDKLKRVQEVVGWIEAAGMYAIVNIHWDGGWIFNENTPNENTLTDDVKSKFRHYWEQIATGFKDVGHQLI